jgi:PAS domain S-box-containing protein
VLGWAIVVPLLLFGAYASGRMADAQADQLRRAMIDEVTNVSSDVDREVLGEIELLQALAASPSLQNDDFAAFQRQAQAPLTMRQSGDIVLFDRGARQIVNTSAPFGTPLPQGSVRELREEVERAFATGKTQITNLYEVPGGKEFRYSIILPVKIDGEIRYALVKTPSEHSLVWTITGNQLPPSWKAVVFDSAHRILAQSEEVPEAIVGKKLPPSQWGRDGSGIVEFTDSEGTPSLQAFHQSELTGWSTAIWATKAVLGAPLQAVWQALGWMALLAFSLVVGLALWVGRIISQSVGHAARAAVALGEGRALPPNGTPVAEVNMLISELQETAAKRQAAEEAVRQSRTMFETLYEQSPDAIIVVDEIGKIDRVNAPAEALFGFSRERMLGQSIEILLPERLRNVHPAHRAGYMKEATTRPMGTGLQLSALRADGSEFPVDILLSPTNIDRRRLVLAVVRDVTERKRVEAQIQLLMRESNHRAKNILSLVQAIGRQTAAGSPEQFMERFTERIQALAANQDLLVSNKWQGVDLEDLLRAQLAHFADLIGARITGSGPKLRLNAATAQAIGLALHELATNAGKYGALSTDRGRVDVRWGTDGDTLTISWTERDGPPVSPPERRGFGSTVIVSMAKTTVGGEVQLDYAPSGLVWRLTCPAANALDAEENRTRGTTGKAKERLTA